MKAKRIRWAGHVTRMGGEEERVCIVGEKVRGKKTARKTKT
jgi:hypothetical protein